MKKLILLSLIVFPILAFCQGKKDRTPIVIPIKDGKIFYEQIVTVDSASKSDLYDKSRKWLAEAFNDSKEVIKVDNKESGNIVGSGIFDIVTNTFFGSASRISFMIDITIKDSKYRAQVYQFSYRLLNNQYATDKFSPLEPVWKKFNEGNSMTPNDDRRLFKGIDDKIKALLEDLKISMTKVSNDNF
ncbi:DUF4468 domain-containing protein [Desertivirga xinjiangensis]|uniref:DUF4468 domain-containing protein n=1 Tax=Desertivirga xinjiangensis TaxID=539206 RepID=UPI00210D4941|nr:DUF4468 domain-containing protein [Pedobacter xinjiangensis]